MLISNIITNYCSAINTSSLSLRRHIRTHDIDCIKKEHFENLTFLSSDVVVHICSVPAWLCTSSLNSMLHCNVPESSKPSIDQLVFSSLIPEIRCLTTMCTISDPPVATASEPTISSPRLK